jgi:hypothetical protein
VKAVVSLFEVKQDVCHQGPLFARLCLELLIIELLDEVFDSIFDAKGSLLSSEADGESRLLESFRGFKNVIELLSPIHFD